MGLLYFKNPALPPIIEDVTTKHLKLNNMDVALQVRQQKGEISIMLLNHEEEIRIELEK